MIDAQTGALISHEEKAKPLASFDEMVKGLDKQKQMRKQIFAQELSSQKDRDRILEEWLEREKAPSHTHLLPPLPPAHQTE